MNPLHDNYNILSNRGNVPFEDMKKSLPGHPRRSRPGDMVILSLQHPYGESAHEEPTDK